MRVSIASDHRYPANLDGRATCRRTDLLARGLAESGHEVLYDLVHHQARPLPEGDSFLECEHHVIQ